MRDVWKWLCMEMMKARDYEDYADYGAILICVHTEYKIQLCEIINHGTFVHIR